MTFFRRLFTFRPAYTGKFYSITVACLRCGEILHGQANLNSELSTEYDERGNVSYYRVRKVLIGKERCFQQIEVTLTFDKGRHLTARQIIGGTFVESA